MGMSVEAFLMNYRDGDPVPFSFDAIKDVFADFDTTWMPKDGILRVTFTEPTDCVDIYCDKDAQETRKTMGLTISRPLRTPVFLERLYTIMEFGNVMLFYSDETTPVFRPGTDPGQFPAGLLEQLGVPRFAESPRELLHQT